VVTVRKGESPRDVEAAAAAAAVVVVVVVE
jgi:hypothetical protein